VALKAALREDTLLVSMMQVNNETGAIQPISDYVDIVSKHPTFFHVDAAQGFGKDIPTLQNSRIDLISISCHKIYAPKGIGALIMRRRGFTSIPLQPIVFGGRQERGLRPGTLPVPLIVGLGLAAEMALENAAKRTQTCKVFKQKLLTALMPLSPIIHGIPERTVPHTISLAFPGLDSEAVMLAVKDFVAVSNGAACTSSSYQPSHVLKAMALSDDAIQGTIRMSWCYMTEEPDWDGLVKAIKLLL
jgi:cysteine desulfurase